MFRCILGNGGLPFWSMRLQVAQKIKKKDVPAMTSCKRPARNASNDARPFKPCKSIKGIKMRDQGRLVEWFDEKGYGFIQPDDAEKSESFAYQRFCTPWTSPIIGCALEYLVILDERVVFVLSRSLI